MGEVRFGLVLSAGSDVVIEAFLFASKMKNTRSVKCCLAQD